MQLRVSGISAINEFKPHQALLGLVGASTGAALWVASSVPPDSNSGAALVGAIRGAMVIVGAVTLLRREWHRDAPELLRVGAAIVAVSAHGPNSRQFLVCASYVLLATICNWAMTQLRATRVAYWLGLTMTALWVTMAFRDVQPTFQIQSASAGGLLRWEAGWPDRDAIVEHRLRWPEIVVPEGLELRIEVVGQCRSDVMLEVFTVTSPDLPYAQPGSALGWAKPIGSSTLAVPAPAEAFTRDGQLIVRMRQPDVDLMCKLIAHRWTSGASGGPDASAIIRADGRIPGAYDTTLHVVREGALLVHLARTADH